MPERYDIRRDPRGWTLYDRFTGEAVVIATVCQAGLSHVDAIEMAYMLNQRARRAILQ